MKRALLAIAVLLVAAGPAGAATPKPAVSAPSAIVVDATSGDVLYARAPNRERAIAR